MMDLNGVATYSDIDEMLANDQIDVVDVTLPPALHESVTVNALGLASMCSAKSLWHSHLLPVGA